MRSTAATKSQRDPYENWHLRAVPTIVIAHTFCASPDTRGFLSVMLSNTVIFLRGLKLCTASRSL